MNIIKKRLIKAHPFMQRKVVLDENFLKNNLLECAYNIIGGYENTLMDYSEEDEEYQNAKEILSDVPSLVDLILSEGKTGLYEEGFAGWGSDVEDKLTKAYDKYDEATVKKWAEEAVNKALN
jgi:hypothetical protein